MGKRTKALERLMTNHNNSMKRAIRWARNHGAEFDELDIKRIERNTHVKFCIYHANDTIECGCHFADEGTLDKMWSMYSEEDWEFKVQNCRIAEFLNHVKNHQSIGKSRVANNIIIDTDISNQFTMEKRLRHDYFDHFEYTHIKLTFHIYHIKEDYLGEE